MGPGAATQTFSIGMILTLTAVVSIIISSLLILLFIGKRVKSRRENDKPIQPHVSKNEDLIAQLKEEYGVSDEEGTDE